MLKIFAIHLKILLDQNAKCFLQNAQLVVEKQKFHLDHAKIAQFIAASALLR